MNVKTRPLGQTADLRSGSVPLSSGTEKLEAPRSASTDRLQLSSAVRPQAYAGVAAPGVVGRVREAVGRAATQVQGLIQSVWQRFQQVFLGGRRQVPVQVEQQASRQLLQQTIAETAARYGNSGVVRDPAVQGRVQAVVDRLAAAAGGKAIRAVVLDDPTANAYSLGGGVVAITRGMLAKMKSEDELAFVMAHEIAHDRNRDGSGMMALNQEKGRLASLLSRIPGGSQVIGMFQRMTEAISRAFENQADAVGLDLATRAGFRPEAAIELNQRFLAERWARGQADVATTHPPFTERIRRLWQQLMGA
ncbi:MAG: M48 family metallopeptidase [Candidatus Sericytochromatia bacterium]|nr:M48 family metallopeptidase [Candidatus Sericytochromatia bacterium]